MTPTAPVRLTATTAVAQVRKVLEHIGQPQGLGHGVRLVARHAATPMPRSEAGCVHIFGFLSFGSKAFRREAVAAAEEPAKAVEEKRAPSKIRFTEASVEFFTKRGRPLSKDEI